MLCLDAKPNTTHYKLAELEKAGKLKAVVTQNIDGLHQLAGTKMCWSFTAVCTEIIAAIAGKALMQLIFCIRRAFRAVTAVAGRIKPDVVLYEEGLDQHDVGGCCHITSAMPIC